MRFKTWPVAALGLRQSSCVLIVVSMLTSVAQGPGNLYPARPAQHPPPQRRRQAPPAAIRRPSVGDLRSRLPARHRARARPRVPRALCRVPSQTNMATRRRAAGARRPRTTAHQQPAGASWTDYWQTFEPLFDWTPTEKIFRSAGFLRSEVVPRREAVLAIAQEIEELNNANLAAQRAEVTRRHAASAPTCTGCCGTACCSASASR